MPPSAAARQRPLLVLTGAVAVPLLLACKGTLAAPGDVNTSQAVMDIGNMVLELRQTNADLQAQIDSLRGVTAYQDTIVRQLAGAAGLALRPSSAPQP